MHMLRNHECKADQRCRESQESLVNIRPSVSANAQPAEVVKPRDGAFHDPASSSESAAMLRSPLGQQRLDAQPPQEPTRRLTIVAPVALERVGARSGPPRFASHCGNGDYEKATAADRFAWSLVAKLSDS